MEIQAICCTLVSCNCDSFKPGKLKRRQCENCKHGWVAHALSKLKVHHMYQGSQVEIVHSNVVFDICSLMLYGTQAIPVRLKILLDRLFSVLKQDEVIQILNALDWTLQDYIRGYVLQDVAGKVLDRWAIMTFEEEIATLQQFLRFGETKSIVELMALQDKESQAVLVPSTRTNSDIRTFIENSTQRSPNLPTKVEKLSTGNVHHFENFINSMAFMLPFQLLNSVPPVLGSTPNALQMDAVQRQEQQACLEEAGLPGESSLLGSSSASFTSDMERADNPLEMAITKKEAEDFPTSDNYSDGPPTPCPSSVSSDVNQMSPDSRMRSLEKSGGLKKGRVYCSACDKTFYDKGTLKIHYNAVHLKIKHKCTIDGCNMVFSSLRSRNRHSANPNPRLHMPMNRNNRDKDVRHTGSPSEVKEEKRAEYCAISTGVESRSVTSYMVNNGDSKLQSSFPNISQSGILFPNLKTVQPVLPFYRSLVTPAELANTPGTLPSLPLISSSVPMKPAVSEASSEPLPKKKSRKSSMPIKIEKEAVEDMEELADGSDSEDEATQAGREIEESGGSGRAFGRQISNDGEDQGLLSAAERENLSNALKRPFSFMQNSNVDANSSTEEDGSHIVDAGLRLSAEGSVITCMSPKQREHHIHSNAMDGPEDDGCVNKPLQDKPCDSVYADGNHRMGNGPLFQKLAGEKEDTEVCADEYADRDAETDPHSMCVDDKDDQPHYCEICNKTFKNPYSVKMHYRNVHLKEMHMCTVDGCNAAFPSRRSRDRHSANLNLHHKLLTKDHYGASSTIYSTSSLCREIASDFRQDFSAKDHVGQTSVIFKGHNRMGLVFPMSKSAESTDPSAEASVGDEAVLDLSTTAASRGSGHSSWDSDGGSEEGVPLEDSDESCDGLSLGVNERLGPELGERSPGCQTPQLQAGSPITCQLCQKVYSNKGTFRAHYKTVHLRLLHKCKVPGCDTTFSSVRSRNRHSQNPNLHRNMTVNAAHEQE
ncbi:zinc finger protein basonuclin-1 isoform X2 [Clupea harengus]|uniref:Zinc finger protein basonuclin-1 isoform X2 n=1 Tax=Clupea harengus TaxID=7950 RepID=A0A6P8FPJ9_CLUHA|nr:zinc finger protein basonuclin-1 isoform X2 [Clupea harengus]